MAGEQRDGRSLDDEPGFVDVVEGGVANLEQQGDIARNGAQPGASHDGAPMAAASDEDQRFRLEHAKRFSHRVPRHVHDPHKLCLAR